MNSLRCAIFAGIWLIVTEWGFAANVVSISVENGAVKRYPDVFRPVMTISYDDGTIRIEPASPYLFSVTPVNVFYILWDGGIVRYGNNQDAVAMCTWKYGETTTTSTIDVKGQIDHIEVPDGTLGRSDIFAPAITLYYTDGTIATQGMGWWTPSTLEMTPGDRVSWLDPMFAPEPVPGYFFMRRGNPPDAVVICTWTWTDGVTATTTSTIDVKGQIGHIEVPNGTLGRSDIFCPIITLYYTDGTTTSQGFGYWDPFTLEIAPGNRVLWNDPIFAPYPVPGYFFTRPENAPNGIVRCSWTWTDGVTVATTSRIAITGGPDGYLTDNSGNYTTSETAQNSASQNKGKRKCPGSCGNGSCDPEDKSGEGPTDYQAGDPIYLNNLEVSVEETDLTIVGRGINYTLERSYRNRINFPGVMGWNWSHNYHLRLMPHPGDSAKMIFYNSQGRGDAYYVVSTGYIAPPSHFKKLMGDSDGYLYLRNRNGTVCKFYPMDGTARAGRLAAQITRCGNRLVFEYDSWGRISTVFDSLSRPIHYFYSASGYLERVVDFQGREVRYTYSPEGDLIEVTRPAVTGTPHGNDFPAGKTTRYTYSMGFSETHLNHNLLTITRPNEVAANGDPLVINTYDMEDRLSSQVWGGVNASGIPAGGTITYVREEINADADPGDLVIPHEIVTITDRNSNVTIYSYNIKKNLVKKEEKTRGIRPEDPESFVTEYRYSDTGLLLETIYQDGSREVSPHDTMNPDQFQNGNKLSTTRYPDARGADQAYLRTTYEYEPVYNEVWKVTEERGNDPDYIPQNGGSNSPGRYTTEYVFDYFEGGLDTPGCACGHTLRELAEMWDIDLTPVLPHLNQGDLNGDGEYIICGNTVLVRYPTAHLRPDSPQVAIEGGTEQVIESRMSYNRYGQIDFEETPEGEITKYFYYPENDPDGDGRDIMTGNNSAGKPFDGVSGGYLKEVIRDYAHSPRYRGTTAPAQVWERVGYNRVGVPIYRIDGRGVRTDYVVNQLDQVVQVTVASDVSESSENLTAYGYKSRVYFDHNDNVVRTEREYRDGNNPDLPQWLETTYTYDILDQVLETASWVSSTETVISQRRYDGNGNLIETISPVAVAGIQSGNRVKTVYDERDRVYQVIRAPETAEETAVAYLYDNYGNLIQTIDAQDHNGDGQGEATTYIFDGYNRILATRDAAGNENRVKYDPAGNVVTSEIWGSIGGPTRSSDSTTGNVLLSRSHVYYDELSRVYQTGTELFVPQGVTPARPVTLSEDDLSQDGMVTSFTDYDRDSRITFTTEASPAGALEISRVYYDGLSRPIRSVDSLQNESLSEYDANSNLVRITTVETDPTGHISPQSLVTYMVYDALNRTTRTTDNLGQTRRFYFDSRGLMIRATDARGVLGPDPLGIYPGSINGDGNATEIVHDGLGRTMRTIRELTTDGEGGSSLDLSNPANPDGKIIEESSWDLNSRPIYVVDDKGNATFYEYDNLDRPVKTIFADGTINLVSFDKDSNQVQFTDNKGDVVTNTFDSLNRLVRKDVTRATGTLGTTVQAFEHDGLSRLTRATDDNDPANAEDDSAVERKYDSLGRILEEKQNSEVVSFNWTQAGDPVDQTYPNGRKVSFALDRLNRIAAITEGTGSTIAMYEYFGSRVARRTYGNGVTLTMLNDAGTAAEGYDNLGRLVKMRHVKDTTLVAGFGYGYNRENMKTYSENLAQPALSELYRYDSTYRLTDFERGPLTAGKDGIAGTPSQTQTWGLDGVGNWAVTTVDGAAKVQVANEMNEYEAFDGVPQAHDENGNLTDDGQYTLGFDFANRLLAVRNKADNALVARYTYDAFNRRTSKYFTRTREEEGPGGEGEYETDANTIGLWHFNETTGEVFDSSGNGNHGKDPRQIERGVEGLWDTNAVEFEGQPIRVAKSQSLGNIEDKLTVETWVYLKTPECKDRSHKKYHKNGKCSRCAKNWIGGTLIHRPASYRLRIQRKDRKVAFTLYTRQDRCAEDRGNLEDRDDDEDEDHPCCRKHPRCGHKLRQVRIESDAPIPTDEWVHLAAVYDGSKVTLLVNSVKQAEEKAITGMVRSPHTPLFLGGLGFKGRLEEARISNVARTTFGGSGGNEPVVIRETVLRSIYWLGWRLAEEQEHVAQEGGQLGTELVTRQFVDGGAIDEHLCTWIYREDGSTVTQTQTRYYHENHRGDTVALTDEQGNAVLRCEYSPYGQAYEVDTQVVLQPLNLKDAEILRYGFQGREIDEETGWLYFRMRYYDARQGRFLQRDPLEYIDYLNLYESFGDSPIAWTDSTGSAVSFSREDCTIIIRLEITIYGPYATSAIANGTRFKKMVAQRYIHC